ncbi:MAG: ECF-type sigma factor [Planctomycetota bacterium]|nr:ECF-type sigma factor [Planctomycetota bacterium]
MSPDIGPTSHEDPTRPDHPARIDQLISLVYEELRSLAEQRLRTLGPGASLQPTELLNEVYLKLGKDPSRSWAGKSHFIGAAAMAMRSILVDRARRAAAIKRGGQQGRTPLEEADIAIERSPDEVLGIDKALTRLEAIDARSAKVVTMRFYLGLDFAEIAISLGVTERTVERDWAFARRWFAQELQANRDPGR